MKQNFRFILICMLSLVIFLSCNDVFNSNGNKKSQDIDLSVFSNYKVAFKGSKSFITQSSRNARSTEEDQEVFLIIQDDNSIEELKLFNQNGNQIDATVTDVFKVANYTSIIVNFNSTNTTKTYLISPAGNTYDITDLGSFEIAFAHNDYLYYLNNYTVYRTDFNELKSTPINNSNYTPLSHFYIMKDDTVLAVNDYYNDTLYVFPSDGSLPSEYGECNELLFHNNQYYNENLGGRVFSFFNDSDGNLYLIRSIGEHFELINIYRQNNQLVYDIISSLYLADLHANLGTNWWAVNSDGITTTANCFDKIAFPLITENEEFTKIILQVNVKNKENPLSYITLTNSTLGNIATPKTKLVLEGDYFYYETTGTKKIKRINLWDENAEEEIIVEDDSLITQNWSVLGDSVVYHTFVTATNINTLRKEFGKEPVIVSNSIVDPIDIIKIN